MFAAGLQQTAVPTNRHGRPAAHDRICEQPAAYPTPISQDEPSILETASKDRRYEEKGATAAQRQQLKEQRAKAYIAEECGKNPDTTCQELRKGLKSMGIRIGTKRVYSLRTKLGLFRPSGSVAGHLRSSSVHAQAREWLFEQRSRDPDIRVRQLQTGLLESFGIDIGTRQLNNILKELGVSRPGPHRRSTEATRKTSVSDADAPARPGNGIGPIAKPITQDKSPVMGA